MTIQQSNPTTLNDLTETERQLILWLRADAKNKTRGYRLGRARLNIPFMTICDALQGCSTVTAAAKKLRCSRPYIYKVCLAEGTDPVKKLKDGGKFAKDLVSLGRIGGKKYANIRNRAKRKT